MSRYGKKFFQEGTRFIGIIGPTCAIMMDVGCDDGYSLCPYGRCYRRQPCPFHLSEVAKTSWRRVALLLSAPSPTMSTSMRSQPRRRGRLALVRVEGAAPAVFPAVGISGPIPNPEFVSGRNTRSNSGSKECVSLGQRDEALWFGCEQEQQPTVLRCLTTRCLTTLLSNTGSFYNVYRRERRAVCPQENCLLSGARPLPSH